MIEGMMSLLELQQLDDELLGLERERDAIPDRRSRAADERSGAEAGLSSAQQGLAEAEAAQREAEQRLQDQEVLLQRLESQQHQVKTNEAYTALLHEMEVARGVISDCETAILESMEAIETARSAVEAAGKRKREIDDRLDAEEQTLAAREKELAEGIAGLRGRRGEQCSPIPRDLLELYERIASRRRPAVVTVRKEMCEGCRVDIPPQSYIEILRAERIIVCGHCQRILIHEERIAAPAAG